MLRVLHAHATRVNLGDDLLAYALRRMLNEAHPAGVEFWDITNQQAPWEDASPPQLPLFELGTSFWAREAAQVLARCQAIALGGGDMICNAPRQAALLRTARELACPIFLLGVGVNFKGMPGWVRRLWRSALPAARLAWAREEDSAAALVRLGIPAGRIRTVPDLAYSWSPDSNDVGDATNAARGGPYGVVSLRLPEGASETWGEAFYVALARALDDAARALAIRWIFLPMVGSWQRGIGLERNDDVQAWEALCRHMKDPPLLYHPERSIPAAEALALFASAGAAVCMRLHACILASIAGLPVIPIAYSAKVGAWARSLGLSEYCIPPTPEGAAEVSDLLLRITEPSRAAGPHLRRESRLRGDALRASLPELSRELAALPARRSVPQARASLAALRLQARLRWGPEGRGILASARRKILPSRRASSEEPGRRPNLPA